MNTCATVNSLAQHAYAYVFKSPTVSDSAIVREQRVKRLTTGQGLHALSIQTLNRMFPTNTRLVKHVEDPCPVQSQGEANDGLAPCKKKKERTQCQKTRILPAGNVEQAEKKEKKQKTRRTSPGSLCPTNHGDKMKVAKHMCGEISKVQQVCMVWSVFPLPAAMSVRHTVSNRLA